MVLNAKCDIPGFPGQQLFVILTMSKGYRAIAVVAPANPPDVNVKSK